MPSFNIHLAVAKRWVEKHGGIKDLTAFYDGSIAPDLTDDKCLTHYTDRDLSKDNLPYFLKNRIGIEKFKADNKIKSDFDRGRYLHVITDYLFYTEFFDLNALEKVWHEDFGRNLYYSYGLTNPHLQTKYGVSFSMTSHEDTLCGIIKKDRAEKKLGTGGESLIIDISKLDEFIEKVSDMAVLFF